jgi:hypothetical protein
MGITITLTDDDALDYLAHKDQDIPATDIDDDLPETLLAAPDVQPTEPETAEEIFEHHFVTPAPRKYPPNVKRPQGPYRHKWSENDYKTIKALAQSSNYSERRVAHLKKKLDPRITDQALATKLNVLGIRVNKGVMYAGQ